LKQDLLKKLTFDFDIPEEPKEEETFDLQKYKKMVEEFD